jgi:hypothetical protein
MQRMLNALTERARLLSRYPVPSCRWSLARPISGSRPGFRSWSRSWSQSLSLMALLTWGQQPHAPAEIIPVRHIAGTVHGYLVQKAEDGHIVAAGDSVQVSHGDQVILRTTFTYKDGSVDDETTVFSQRGTFHLISDHHVQRGPFFSHPTDLLIDARTGQVTTHATGKDGKDEVHTAHMTLPADLANGMVSQIVGSLKAHTQTATVSLLVTAPKPRIVKLVISPVGEDNFSIAGVSKKALHYQIKILIGGVVGLVAPLVGKAPPDIDLWVVGGDAPTFLREKGPTFQDGPMLTIELVSPDWSSPAQSSAPKSGT